MIEAEENWDFTADPISIGRSCVWWQSPVIGNMVKAVLSTTITSRYQRVAAPSNPSSHSSNSGISPYYRYIMHPAGWRSYAGASVLFFFLTPSSSPSRITEFSFHLNLALLNTPKGGAVHSVSCPMRSWEAAHTWHQQKSLVPWNSMPTATVSNNPTIP
jgi:hypothetical protein